MSTGVGVCATANSTQNPKLRKRRSLALTALSLASRALAASERFQIAPTIVEKMEKKALFMGHGNDWVQEGPFVVASSNGILK
jgi:hypothetical protein